MKSYVGRPLRQFFISIEVLFLALLTLFFMTGCLDEGSGNEDATQVVADPGEVDLPPLTTPERTVCDPFSAGTSARDRGLVGNLLYLEDDQPRYDSIDDYMEFGTPIQSTLYFDQLFVPTRAFDLGFYTQDGQLVTNSQGESVYEYFALRLESQLVLADNEEEGWYQMAILSDDGSRLTEKLPDGTEDIIIDNNRNTPTRMNCAVKSVYLDQNSKIPVVLSYFQGPRYHIALNVLWRPLPDGVDPNDPVADEECGRSGNSRYFDSTQVPSEPSPVYYGLLERGWKPLTNENYEFPVQASNPCASDDPLLLTNFSILSTTRTEVTVSWNTSRNANSQVEIKDVMSGQTFRSPLDPTMKTTHSVTYSGLSVNTLYSIKAISEAPDGSIAISSESAFRTPR
jgi:hypothetical protein